MFNGQSKYAKWFKEHLQKVGMENKKRGLKNTNVIFTQVDEEDDYFLKLLRRKLELMWMNFK